MNRYTKRISRGAAVLAACWVLVACERQATTDELISRAEQYLQKGDFRSATIELKNAVAADVESAQARWLLGKTYFESGDLEGAEKELDRARELGAPAADVLPLLAKVQSALGKHKEVLDLDSRGLSAQAQAVVLAAQALAAFANGDGEAAGKRMEQALAADSKSAYVRVANVRLLLANGQREAARKQLDETLTGERAYAPAWSLLGDIEQVQQHPDLAEEAYSRALDIDPGSFDDRLKRALLRVQLKQTEEAAQDVAVLRESAPAHPGTFFAEGMLHLQKNELESAKDALEQTAREGGSFPLALFYLAAIHAQQGNRAQAENYSTQFLTVAPDNPLGLSLAANLALQAGNFVRAEQFVRRVVAADETNVVALNTLAAALLAQGKTDEGLDVLAKVAGIQPDSALAQTRLGAGLLASGHGGTEHLRKALELDPNFQQADVLLVLDLLRRGDRDGAIRAAEDFRARHPDAVTAHNLLGRVYLAAGDPDKARVSFAEALEIAPGDPGASQSLAGLAVRAKDYDAARNYFAGVLEKHPDYLPVHIQLAALDLMQGKEAAMVERLDALMKTYPAAIEPRLVLARYKVGKGQATEALELLNGLDETQKKQPRVLAQLATAQLAKNDYRAAKVSLDRLVQLQPGNARNHYQLALVHDGLGDSVAVRKELDKAIELDPKHVAARVALARILLANQEVQQFEAQLDELRQIRPNHPDVLLLEASLARLRGDEAGVLEKLERAYAVTPTASTVRSLAAEKVRRGDRNRGLKLLEDWIGGHENDAATRMMLAEVYGAGGQIDNAIAQYRLVLESAPQSVVALNNLAWHLRKQDPEQALVHAKRANELAPDSADALDTLALVLLENREVRQAQTRIEQALKLAPEDPGLRYHAALIRYAAGDTGGALVILEPVLEGEKQFPERQEAAEFLASIKK